MYFYTPSAKAKRLLYYPLCAGEFYCNSTYEVKREQYNSFLLLLVLEGEIVFRAEKAVQNELLLIDCYAPHTYYTETNAHTLWLHFDGNNSRELFESILTERGQKIKCPAATATHFREMIQLTKGGGNEAVLSSEIYALLCALLTPEKSNDRKTSAASEAKKYIAAHFDETVRVDDLAKAAHMSTSHFARLFKEATTFSPYEYLLGVRLEKAKELLLKTELSVSEIAYKTGFNSDANFICYFKKEVGISPLQFRKMQF